MTARRRADPVAPEKEGAGLRFLYHTVFGRVILKMLSARWLSRAAGAFMRTRASKILIKPFVRSAGIDLGEYVTDGFSCFNDCFTRQIRPGLREFDPDPEALCAPCDGLLTVYGIGDDPAQTVFPAKQSAYSVATLLGDASTAALFAGGHALVFRLCVEHYHRYAFFDGGVKRPGRFIPGRLHTVRPIALEACPVFTENCREATLIDTDNFGTAAEIEIGALLVGKIANARTDESFRVRRGDEKGMFLYGGSTVVLLLARGAADIDSELIASSEAGLETPVRMGERIGEAALTRG